jgi:hypothetical protein
MHVAFAYQPLAEQNKPRFLAFGEIRSFNFSYFHSEKNTYEMCRI